VVLKIARPYPVMPCGKSTEIFDNSYSSFENALIAGLFANDSHVITSLFLVQTHLITAHQPASPNPQNRRQEIAHHRLKVFPSAGFVFKRRTLSSQATSVALDFIQLYMLCQDVLRIR
jgi:hypothetical protein